VVCLERFIKGTEEGFGGEIELLEEKEAFWRGSSSTSFALGWYEVGLGRMRDGLSSSKEGRVSIMKLLLSFQNPC